MLMTVVLHESIHGQELTQLDGQGHRGRENRVKTKGYMKKLAYTL